MTTEERRTTGRRASDSITGVAFEDAFVALTDGILISDGTGKVLSANPALGGVCLIIFIAAAVSGCRSRNAAIRPGSGLPVSGCGLEASNRS